jgi:hypothetical protein
MNLNATHTTKQSRRRTPYHYFSSIMDVLRPATPPKPKKARQVLLVGLAKAGEPAPVAPPVWTEPAQLPADAPAAERAKAERSATVARRRFLRRSSLAAAAGLLNETGVDH